MEALLTFSSGCCAFGEGSRSGACVGWRSGAGGGGLTTFGAQCHAFDRVTRSGGGAGGLTTGGAEGGWRNACGVLGAWMSAFCEEASAGLESGPCLR